ncbi:MAG: YopT-type cysteine protease domain-containing protein [Endozoicomonas sp. (ex Botrylloides leachii)]|nr:YopT-type cysteine protease domain-containing protein [Endozoicomonas sp. (ex Botrylloides leachii)]
MLKRASVQENAARKQRLKDRAGLRVYIDKVQERVTRFGGYCSWKISQDIGLMRITRNNAMKLAGESQRGVCLAFCAQWIISLSKGQYIRDLLCDSSGEVIPNKVRQLVIQHLTLTDMSPASIVGAPRYQKGQINGELAVQLYLSQKGLKAVSLENFHSPGSFAVGLPEKIISFDSNKGYFLMITLKDDYGSGHAVCAQIANKITFFDPGFGEFAFDNKNKFKTWFCEFLLNLTDYSEKYTRYSVFSFIR